MLAEAFAEAEGVLFSVFTALFSAAVRAAGAACSVLPSFEIPKETGIPTASTAAAVAAMIFAVKPFFTFILLSSMLIVLFILIHSVSLYLALFLS